MHGSMGEDWNVIKTQDSDWHDVYGWGRNSLAVDGGAGCGFTTCEPDHFSGSTRGV